MSSKINSLRILYTDGQVYLRIMKEGGQCEDAIVSIGCLTNMVADGAKIQQAIMQDLMARRSEVKSM